MTRTVHRIAAALAASALASSPAFASCKGSLAVQVLGSGGPVADDARASSGYLVWVDGEARLLVDAGGGVFLRFGEAKAKFEQLDAVAITHLHADHVADLTALMKSGFFSERDRELPIFGPTAGGAFPSMTEFMKAQFDPEKGAFRYLSNYLDGKDGSVKTPVEDIDATASEPKQIFANDRIKVTAIGVKHGPVPAVGYLVEAGGKRIAFAGDQNGENPAFAAMINDADLLVMDHAIPEGAEGVASKLHARPSEIAELATKSDAKKLVLSHNMARSLGALKENLATIAKGYNGPTIVAEDLSCFSLKD